MKIPVTFFSALSVLFSLCGPLSADEGLPNIVYILADDMGYGDVSALNPDSKINTPHIDRLAKEGMVFTDAHSGSSVCTPTRYGILTGRYSWRTRLKSNVLRGYDPHLIEPDRITVASLLKENGYRTACIGKWHIGMDFPTTNEKPAGPENTDWNGVIENGPIANGFDYFYGISASLNMDPYIYIENDRFVGECTTRKTIIPDDSSDKPGPAHEDFEGVEVLTEISRKSVEYIGEQDSGTPFFMYIPLTSPHRPILPSAEFQGKSDLSDYADFCLQTDAVVGEICEALEAKGFAENTLVIYTSDNGSLLPTSYQPHQRKGHHSSHIFRGKKGDIHEGGHRVPYLLRWPGVVKPGSQSDEIMCLTDLLATCAAIVGAPLPDDAGEDSYNMLPAMRGDEGSGPIREATVHHSFRGMFSVRQGDWKLILGPGTGGLGTKPSDSETPTEVQLYDLNNDIGEKEGVHGQHPEVVARLSGLLKKYKTENRSRPVETSAPAEPVAGEKAGSATLEKLALSQGEHITIVGAGLASRMMKYSRFETELQLRHPDKELVIRNIADEGNTPGFRPHAGREFENQFAFPGAKELVRPEFQVNSGSRGHFETPDEWLTRLETDTILAFFGYNSSFGGPTDVERFKKELAAYIEHLQGQQYNGESAPQLAFVSPTAVQDLSAIHHTPTGETQNENIALYTGAMREVCDANGVLFIDIFGPSKALFEDTEEPLTVDGALLTDRGYQWLAPLLADELFGKTEAATQHLDLVHDAVAEKNWVWHNLFKIPNGVHVFGARYKPYGPENYPDELKKLTEMAAARDRAIWRALEGETIDLAAADAKTHQLPEIQTNYTPSDKNGETRYLSGEETLEHLKVPEGYQIELFADEKMFPELANPCQMSFDNKGRLWVGCMPSYPHWRPGDPKPQDSLLILEDTDNDGKADKRTVFADDLHLCIGFELAAEGVYVSQADSLILLTDTDGDDQYDTKEYLLSGFDDHDTHHAISAFCVDPSGAIYMGEGVFLHSNVESVYGTHRGTNGGFYRYNPKRRHLERTAQLEIPNPWGTAFDRWGQQFFLFTSGSFMNWMAPGTVKPLYGHNMEASRNLLRSNRVRPNSGLEIVSSRHFPDEVQGDLLLNNNISFLGTKQHPVSEDGTGYNVDYRQDLLKSDEGNFRPVNLEFAPDGSLYVIDWSNVLIGHMQHSARDPLRDHVHGRVYRITYPSRPLVEPARIDGASIPELLENLKLHEDRTRYRTRRELRGRDTDEVLAAIEKWVAELDQSDENYEHHLLEALWVSWGHDAIDEELLHQLLKSDDHRVRAAAVRGVRYNTHQVEDYAELLTTAAADNHGRVRMEAITAASWLGESEGLAILDVAEKAGLDDWIEGSMKHARAALTNTPVVKPKEVTKIPRWLKGKDDKELFLLGKEVYHRDAHCVTCHQADAKGLPDAGFPPISRTKWVNGDADRLILLTLKGLVGEIEVSGKKYMGAMTPFEGLLDDKEVAAVLTYVRNSFGNKASVIQPESVKKIRDAHEGKPDLLQAPELLKQYPHTD